MLDTALSPPSIPAELACALHGAEAQRPIKRRDPGRIWASDIGGPYLDRYLAQHNVPPNNPPDEYALRSFAIGKAVENAVAGAISGIIAEPGQRNVVRGEWGRELTYNTFRNGASIGGDIDLVHLPSETGYEIKSVRSDAFGRIKKEGPYPHHKLQVLTYLLGKGQRPEQLKSARLVYVDRSSLDMLSFPVSVEGDAEAAAEWEADVEEMIRALRSDTLPPPPPLAVLQWGRWVRNWRVTYTRYSRWYWAAIEPERLGPKAATYAQGVVGIDEGNHLRAELAKHASAVAKALNDDAPKG